MFAFHFNPHSHAGSDLSFFARSRTYHISIHTPTQGVTYNVLTVCDDNGISIHTPTQGVTYNVLTVCDDNGISIHTPTQGVTYNVLTVCDDNGISIHTPTQGVTLVLSGDLLLA